MYQDKYEELESLQLDLGQMRTVIEKEKERMIRLSLPLDFCRATYEFQIMPAPKVPRVLLNQYESNRSNLTDMQSSIFEEDDSNLMDASLSMLDGQPMMAMDNNPLSTTNTSVGDINAPENLLKPIVEKTEKL